MYNKLDEQGFDDNDTLEQWDIMSYLYDRMDTLEEKLLVAELGSDRLAEIGAEHSTTANVLKAFKGTYPDYISTVRPALRRQNARRSTRLGEYGRDAQDHVAHAHVRRNGRSRISSRRSPAARSFTSFEV